MRLIERSLLFLSPREGALVYGNSFYVTAGGAEKLRVRGIETRSDLLDAIYVSRSADNGRTWGPEEEVPCVFPEAAGVRRVTPSPGFVDPITGSLLTLSIEGVLPHDDPMEGMKRYYLTYGVSRDGGRTEAVRERVVQEGRSAEAPFDCVVVGKNSIFLGDNGSRPIRTREGKVLVPAQVTPLGPDGTYWNPGGGYSYHEALVLIGTWGEGWRIRWEASQRVANDPAASTRGAIEPTLAQMPDGRILMVLRGSNDVKPHLPGRRWFCVSADGGRRWGPVRPWTYDDGTAFHSPSSMSQLLVHSSGRVFWLGNICPANPAGNHPRYPLVAGEVDPAGLLLKRSGLLTVDDKAPGEDGKLTLSNFMAHEDRETGDILLHMSRWMSSSFSGNAYLYRLRP